LNINLLQLEKKFDYFLESFYYYIWRIIENWRCFEFYFTNFHDYT